MDRRNYEIIEHTADIGIRVKADNLDGLFKNAALAMFEIIAEKRPQTTDHRPQAKNLTLKQKAENVEELFINWLNELLSLSATRELIFYDFKMNKLDRGVLEAVAIGEDIKDYKINTEIKAATYHELKIEDIESGWQVEVIFDV